MTRSAALTLQAIAALFIGAAAGFVLVDPGSVLTVVRFDDYYLAEPDVWTGWQTVFDAAPGLGVLVAAAATLLLRRARAAWTVAASALLGIVIAQAPVLDPVAAQAGQRYAVLALAGLALGAAAAAAWGERAPTLALLAGAALALLFSAVLYQLAGQDVLPRHLAEYLEGDYVFSRWLWLLVVAAALALGAAALPGGPGAARPAGGARWPILAAAALVAVGGSASYGAAAADPPSWGRLAAGLLVAFAALGAAAWLLPDRDGGLLFTALAVAAVGAPLAKELSLEVLVGVALDRDGLHVPSSVWAGLVVSAAAVLLGAGAWAGNRWPLPPLGFGLLALVALLGIPVLDDARPMAIARSLLLALGAGFLLAATRPATPAGGAIGVTTLFTLMAPASLVGVIVSFGWFAYTPLTDSAESLVADTGITATGALIALAAVAAACGGGVALLSRARP